MENFTLNQMVEAARAAGYRYIIGEYLPTPKNSMVKDHFANLGFERMAGSATDQFILNVDEYKERECYIKKK